MIENRNVNIITDADGKKLVLINDILFKGKRQIDWDDVKQYLEGYVGDYYDPFQERSDKSGLCRRKRKCPDGTGCVSVRQSYHNPCNKGSLS